MAGVQQLLDCMISRWYPNFQRATFKTVILPLPQPVLDWLVSDGLHLPDDSEAFAKRGPMDEHALDDEYREWSDGEEGEAGSDAGSAAPQPPPAELAELRRQLADAIADLGGRVVPKLSWSCPKDAVWMSPSSSLCCTNPDEVLLLLRSSDRVAHDICAALPEAAAAAGAAAATAGEAVPGSAAGEAAPGLAAGAAPGGAGPAPGSDGAVGAAGAAGPRVQHCLALRRWHDLQPGREFRCFVRGHALVGACQRDLTQCFDFLREEQGELSEALAAFHAKHVQGRFPHADFTYDVYIATSGAVKLLDFNPLGGTTAPLLFSWEELGLAGGLEAAGADGAAGSAASGAASETAAGSAGVAEPGSAADGTSRQPAAACSGCCAPQQGAEAVAAAAEPADEAAGGPAAPSYLEQLRRVQALSLAEQQQQQQQQQQPAAGEPQTTSQGMPAAASPRPPPFELRIIEEPVALRPATLAYGVPFDFVDSSEGSALDRLMQKAQQAGAGELWAVLAAQGDGGGAAGSS